MSRSPRSKTRFVAIPFSFLSALLLLSLNPSTFDAQADVARNATVELAQSQYPFQNPDLPIGERLNNLLSLMTLDETIACLGTNPSVPPLGVKDAGQVEGIHGLA